MLYTTEVDGVPTLVAPTAGPMNVGLVFRVGQADETLPTHGITHLVEHLALHDSGLSDYHYNGATASVYTHFHMQGSEADVVTYLGKVCAGLRNLPMHRLDTEKEILRTEARSRGGYPSMPLWRYGAQGYGLPGYPEWGLFRLRPEDLRSWVDTYFTRDNAVLWIAGNGVPAGLRLDLPGGVRRPLPAATSALPATPAYFCGDDASVLHTAVVRRSTPARMYADVLERALYRELRQEGGFSYTASTSYDPRGDGYATVSAYADALPEKQGAVLGGFIDVLARMRLGRIEEHDLASVRTKTLESLTHPEVEAARLPGHALNLLTGQPLSGIEQLRAEITATTLDDVRAVAVEAAATALLQTPARGQADWAGFTEAPTTSATVAAGTRYLYREDPQYALMVGADAVSVVQPESFQTVRYAACAAMLTWPDGARRLVGHDGIVVHLEPTLWHLSGPGLSVLDQAVHPSLHIAMPARDPESIPQPDTRQKSRGQAAAAPVGSGRNGLEIVGMVLLGLLSGFFALIVLLFAGYMLTADTLESADWTILTCSGVGAAVFAVPLYLLLRTRRARRR
ncbi:insulinase family protein [Catellatospora sp. KI3]|uniref:M16 family metallopeptidase n=1 Tax=Catellatospora sp. KI3 TaxID=3041620 RepID=UPI002482E095|nr:insulinase family protein [Catellatospora sp. KI3]MDI1464374.1 insulinase family protein [Catellatospora sp. KI3]